MPHEGEANARSQRRWLTTLLVRVALAEQIEMIIQLPVNQVEVIGIEDTGKQRGDWHQQD